MIAFTTGTGAGAGSSAAASASAGAASGASSAAIRTVRIGAPCAAGTKAVHAGSSASARARTFMVQFEQATCRDRELLLSSSVGGSYAGWLVTGPVPFFCDSHHLLRFEWTPSLPLLRLLSLLLFVFFFA